MTHSPKALVLLVDDEPLVRLIACDSLEEAGFEVVEAVDADAALAVLKSRPDVGVLFTDVNMPGSMDGLQLTELVHKLWPDIKLVITSGRVLQRPVPDAGKFLAKPYSMKTMTDTVTAVNDAA